MGNRVSSPNRIDLAGTWQYTPVAWTTITADGTIESSTVDLPSGGTMKLPMNWQLRGLDSFDGRVRFERAFEAVSLQSGERAFLVFHGVDYFAQVSLNGETVGQHAGYFQRFEFEVTHLLQDGENHIAVEVDCPKEEPGTVWPDKKWLIKGILSHWDARPGSWDHETGQEQNSGGIWGDVYIERRSAAFVTNVRAASTLTPAHASDSFFNPVDEEVSGEQAIVRVEFEVDTIRANEYEVTVDLDEHQTTLTLYAPQGRSRHVAVIHVPEPKLWWPWDLGEPYLYRLSVRLAEAPKDDVVPSTLMPFEWSTSFGIRQIDLDPHSGEWRVNGRRFFVRGTNVIPTLWLGEYDDAMIQRDIDLLKAAHINGVRVCVHVNREEFYAACDRAGIIVWQDFALQWAYTTDPRFTQEAIRQVQEMVDQLYNHASIALWCTQNESSFHNKMILNPALAQAAAQRDASRYVRATSEFSEHAYPGWYRGEVRDYVTLPGAPILTEFGAQALPSVAEVRQMRGGERWPPDWTGLAYHDFQHDQTFHVAGIPLGDGLADFVEHSQRYQADLLKFAIEQYRQKKYTHIGGLFQFMFMDCWPSITWSVLSYERVPKQGYHTLQQVYQPVLIGANLERQTVLIGIDKGSHARPFVLDCWVVNDRHQALNACHYSAKLINRDGDTILTAEGSVDRVAADSVTKLPPLALALTPDLADGPHSLSLCLHADGEVVSRNEYRLNLVHPGEGPQRELP